MPGNTNPPPGNSDAAQGNADSTPGNSNPAPVNRDHDLNFSAPASTNRVIASNEGSAHPDTGISRANTDSWTRLAVIEQLRRDAVEQRLGARFADAAP